MAMLPAAPWTALAEAVSVVVPPPLAEVPIALVLPIEPFAVSDTVVALAIDPLRIDPPWLLVTTALPPASMTPSAMSPSSLVRFTPPVAAIVPSVLRPCRARFTPPPWAVALTVLAVASMPLLLPVAPIAPP